jgi:glutathione S-transferase
MVMSEIVVHGVPGSPFLRAVLVGLEEKGQPYRVQALGPGESKGEAYMKLHPFGRIPAFSHGDFVLYETQAILRYLDDVFPEPALEPKDARTAAKMNQIIGINDWYLFPQAVRVIGFHRIVGPALMGLTPDEAAIAAAVPDTRHCIAVLDRLAGDGPFLTGSQLTIADLLVAPQMDFLALTPEGAEALKTAPRLTAWLERMRARPSMQATLPPEMFRKAA